MTEKTNAGASKEKPRKQIIIEAAFDALRKTGLPSLSYDAIAQEAGLSRQLIRYHYSDPETLMLDVCDYMAGLYRDALTSTAGQLEGPARVEMFLDFYFDLLDGTPKPRDDRVYDAMMALTASSPRIRAALATQYGLLGHVLSHEFAVQFPELAGPAADELSYLFVCLMYGHWKMVESIGFSPEHRRITRAAMDRLIRSYRDNPPDKSELGMVWKQSPPQ